MIMCGSMRGRLTRVGALALLGIAIGALAVGPAFSRADPDSPSGKNENSSDHPDQPISDRDSGQNRSPTSEELDKARQELSRAREEADKALQRVRELEERMARLSGGDRSKDPPLRDGKVDLPGGNDHQLRELQKQIEDMRKMIDALRRDVRDINTPKEPPPMGDRRGMRPMGPGFPGGFAGRPGNDGPGPRRPPDKDR